MSCVLVAVVWVVAWQGVLPASVPQQDDSDLPGNTVFNQIALAEILDEFRNYAKGASETRSNMDDVVTWLTTHRQQQDDVTQELRQVSAGVKSLSQQISTHLQQSHPTEHNSCGNMVDVLRRDILLRDSVIRRLQLDKTLLNTQSVDAFEKASYVRNERQQVLVKLQMMEEIQQQFKVKVEEVRNMILSLRVELEHVDLLNEHLKQRLGLKTHEALLEKGRSLHLETAVEHLEHKTRELEEERDQREQGNSDLLHAQGTLEENAKKIEKESMELAEECTQLEETIQQLKIKSQEIMVRNEQLEQTHSNITKENQDLIEIISNVEAQRMAVEERNEALWTNKEALAQYTDKLSGQIHYYESGPCS
ncbi:restin homolog isoform X2 [Homarus americanus]|uniref:restin homolog isoform X2 n=1 Tax=Homarus americanus TaxID=6706 RepID=UPI001C48FB82|nr:restin homolog isoform X2 [Homarus americanus]